MTPEEEQIIRVWGKSLQEKKTISFVRTRDEAGKQIEAFCEKLSRLVPHVQIKPPEGEGDLSAPEIRVRPNLRYQALPLGRELEPFLKGIHSLDPLAEDLPPSVREALHQVVVPATLKVYVTSQCPFCPLIVSRCLALAEAHPDIQVLVIDGLLFPDVAEIDQVRSVPTLILDDGFRWTGSVDLEELVTMILKRDPAKLGQESLKQMLESGRAADLTRMMILGDTVFPALLDLLGHPKWSIRLGAMVVFEELAEKRPDLASRVAADLWERFSDLEEGAQGDVLYLFGQSRDPALISRLKSVLGGTYPPEVKEAAAEAIETLSRLPPR
jgi:hypothetical protein